MGLQFRRVKRSLVLAVAVSAVLSVGCSRSLDSDINGTERDLAAAEFESETGETWPLTVQAGTLYCRDGSVYFQVGGNDYLLGEGKRFAATEDSADITKPGAGIDRLQSLGKTLC